jgi:hypothetical protein
MGTEIRTFNNLKELSEYIIEEISQHKSLYEDYSQWLGSLLRNAEATCKDEEWYKKSAILQKNLRSQAKRAPEKKETGKKNGKKGQSNESSIWVQSNNICLSSADQGQIEILFEAIEKINAKVQELEKFKSGFAQLERLGLGLNVNYVVLICDDVPRKIVLKIKGGSARDEMFRFDKQISVSAPYFDLDNEMG